MIYILDTDTFTLAHRGTRGLRDRIDAEREAHEIVISLVTWIEVLRGRFEAVVKATDGNALSRAQARLISSEEYMVDFRVLLFDTTSTAEFDRLQKDKKARKAGRNDLLIACIALAHDATLVTRNTKDFANIPGLKVENWAD